MPSTLQKAKILESASHKILLSPDHNFKFNKDTGFHARWGKTLDEDPDYGFPEIADIEISEVCGQGCSFCYKSNTGKGRNMDLATFKRVFANLPKSVTQIAFGIGDIDGNPDLFPIMQHARDNGVIPNITVNGAGLSYSVVKKLAAVCGAVAVSLYDEDVCYDAVKALTDAVMSQVNIHCMLSRDRLTTAENLLGDMKCDIRLKKLNAAVFLSLKKRGRGKHHECVSQYEFSKLVQGALREDLPIGFDSCSAFKFLEAVSDREDYDTLQMLAEPCESTCFSLYINTAGEFYPCSFMEGKGDWADGIDCTKTDLDFMRDVWDNERTKATRELVIEARKQKRGCFFYEV